MKKSHLTQEKKRIHPRKKEKTDLKRKKNYFEERERGGEGKGHCKTVNSTKDSREVGRARNGLIGRILT